MYKKGVPNYKIAQQYLTTALENTAGLSPNVQPKYKNRIYNAMGVAYLRAGEHNKALDAFKQSINHIPQKEHDNRLMVAYLNMGETLALSGETSSAWVWLKKAEPISLGLPPNRLVELRRVIGLAHQLAGDHQKAVAAFDEAVAISNQNIPNEDLLRVLEHMKDSYAALTKEGDNTGTRYMKLTKIEDKQTSLRVEMEQRTGSAQLSEVAAKEIATSKANALVEAVNSQKDTFMRIAMVLGLFSLLAFALSRFEYRRFKFASAEGRQYKANAEKNAVEASGQRQEADRMRAILKKLGEDAEKLLHPYTDKRNGHNKNKG